MKDCICQLQGLGEWLYNWQTLLSGVLALGAAVWAGKLLRAQIAQADVLHQKDVERSHNAARVALPMALSEVSQYVQKIADQVADELEKYQPGSELVPRAELVRQGAEVDPFLPVVLPKDVIPLFQAFVQTLTDQSSIRHVAELLSSIQILNSRYQGFNFNQVAVDHSLYRLFIDASKVSYLNDRLFNYGRYLDSENFGKHFEEPFSESWVNILRKAEGLLFSRRFPDHLLNELGRRINRRKEANDSPWLERMDL